jgi:hypothetical protein
VCKRQEGVSPSEDDKVHASRRGSLCGRHQIIWLPHAPHMMNALRRFFQSAVHKWTAAPPTLSAAPHTSARTTQSLLGL